MRAAGWIVCLASIGWALTLFAAPRARQDASLPVVVRTAGVAAYLAGHRLCHQRPERSFVLHGTPLPVCARCLGLYVGAPLGAFLILLGAGRPGSWHWSWRRWRTLLLICAVPTVISLTLEWIGGPSGLWSRALAAFPLGAMGAAIVTAGVTGRLGPPDR